MSCILEIKDLSVSFRSAPAPTINNLSLELKEGHAYGLVGESGSGKSLTAMAVLGMLPPGATATGEAKICGTDMLSASPGTRNSLRGSGAAMIFQNPMVAFNPYYTIGSQMADITKRQLKVPQHEALQHCLSMLDRVGIQDPSRQLQKFPHQFSGGQLQRIMIAIALLCRPKLLIADEATTALDVTVQHQILELLADLQKSEKLTLLFISHDLAVVASLCDRIGVMQAGQIVEEGKTSRIISAPETEYTRLLLDAVPQLGRARTHTLSAVAPEAAVKVENLTVTFENNGRKLDAVKNVSFELGRGRSLGIVGESGSGKTTLAMTILGLQLPSAGRIEIDSLELSQTSKAQRRELMRRMGVVFQNPYSSLDPRMTVRDIIAEPLRTHTRSTAQALDTKVNLLLESVGMAPEHRLRYPAAFSGGQRQRIAIARALALDPEFLVLDEPTAALDVSVQAQILDLLKKLKEKHGLSYLFVSHDLALVEQIADEVLVMRRGVAVEYGPVEKIFTHPEQSYTRELIASIPSLETATTKSMT